MICEQAFFVRGLGGGLRELNTTPNTPAASGKEAGMAGRVEAGTAVFVSPPSHYLAVHAAGEWISVSTTSVSAPSRELSYHIRALFRNTVALPACPSTMADLHRATTRAAARKEIAAAASKATPKTNPTPSKRKRDTGENRKTPQKIFAGKASASKDEDDELPSKLAKRISWADIASGAAMLREYQDTPTAAAAAAPISAAGVTALPSKIYLPSKLPKGISSADIASGAAMLREYQDTPTVAAAAAAAAAAPPSAARVTVLPSKIYLPSKLPKGISSADIARGAAMLREYQNTPTTAAAAAPQSAARATVLPSKTRWPDREPYSLSSPSFSSSSSDEEEVEEVEEVEEDDDEGDDDDGDSDAQTPPNKHGKYENIHPTILRVIQAALERRFVIPVLEIINDMMKPEPASESQPSSDDDDDDNAGPSTLHRSDGPVFDHSSSDFDDMEDATASLPFRQQVLDLWDSVEADRQANPIQWPGGRSMAMAGARERMRRETERPVGASVFSAAPPTRGGGLFPPRPQASRGRRGW
ncbi:hypothetical protein IWZ01DRAFT_291867 [Phyllosticta capitalensis]